MDDRISHRIEVERAEELVSSGYLHIRSEPEMRSTWRVRRAALDAEFEVHVERDPFQPKEKTVGATS